MVTLQLDDRKTDLLKQVLDVSLSELHMEIAHTDSWEYREMLKEREESLKEILHELLLNQAVF